MKKILTTTILILIMTALVQAQEKDKSITAVSKQFVHAADIQDRKLLAEVLEENSLQYVHMGGKLSQFTASDYIKLVSEKKLGGVPRKVTVQHEKKYGNNVAVVVLNAVSHEYDFLYQLTLSKNEKKEWVIVGIMTEINGA